METVAHERGKQAVYQWPQLQSHWQTETYATESHLLFRLIRKHLQLFHKCHYPDFQDKDLIDLHKG